MGVEISVEAHSFICWSTCPFHELSRRLPCAWHRGCTQDRPWPLHLASWDSGRIEGDHQPHM